MRELRIAADWRLSADMDKVGSSKIFLEYFSTGKFMKLSLLEWVRCDGSTGRMPAEIVDERMYKRPETS